MDTLSRPIVSHLVACATPLASPFGKARQHIRQQRPPCLAVDKVGNSTDLMSFVELALYNSSADDVFSAEGDSGALVWHAEDGKARIVGWLHSGQNAGGRTSNHIPYLTPGWLLLEEIKKRFPYAKFARTS
ncbi:hypothetical protein PLICRDRAFT_180471 [Plicaturopsis crispa FD-325 SS-3]|uniref:Uncharacterized protein n=1 Tax=Plicaturopsis crispa FD-325 SS-3 TaxID=944288 RepID=A0A0C9T299_PLICR|nr:hypothetical protein PLICRDRAFT_180471 [Plicaturopsis crispa FD-325 SS-3]